MSSTRDELVQQARDVLSALDFDKARRNERSALTLLGLRPGDSWADATRGLYGVTPLMNWMAEYLDKRYAPNSRETVRRQTLHQFVDAALVILNPDDPSRPVNSGKSVYQIDERVGFTARGGSSPLERMRKALVGRRRSGAAAADQAAVDGESPS